MTKCIFCNTNYFVEKISNKTSASGICRDCLTGLRRRLKIRH